MAHVATSESFQDDISDGVVLVDFYADWCGPCQAIAPVIDELSSEYEGKAKVIKLDVDASSDVAQQFWVMSIPTMLVFKNWEFVDKSVWAWSKEDLKALIDAHLDA